MMKYPGRALADVFWYFLRLGTLGFGGPLALMATMQRDLVERRRWTTMADWTRALALIKALPGPTATQVAVYLGYLRAGRLGGLLAGASLIFPAFVMMILLGVFYASIRELAWSKSLLLGMQAAAIGVILDGTWRLTASYRGEPAFWAVALLAGIVTLVKPAAEPVVILGAGLLGVLSFHLGPRRRLLAFSPAPLLLLTAVFLKAGAFNFGTGLAIVPMLAHDVVDRLHWLTHEQFMDALAFGQITPGPVVITSTFIGYKVAGLTGACVATAAVFAPAFFNILTWFPWAERKVAGRASTARFVMWAIAAVIGAIVVTVGRLVVVPGGGSSQILFFALAAGALATALWSRLPSWAIIPTGGLAAALIRAFHG